MKTKNSFKPLFAVMMTVFLSLFISCSDDSNDIEDQRPFTEKYAGKVLEWGNEHHTYYWIAGPSHLEVGDSNGKFSTPYDTFQYAKGPLLRSGKKITMKSSCSLGGCTKIL